MPKTTIVCKREKQRRYFLTQVGRTYYILLLQIKRQKLRQRPEGSTEQKRKRATMAQDQRASKAVATLWKNCTTLYQVRGCYILRCFYKPFYTLHQISGETLWPSFYSLQKYPEAQGYRIRLLSSTFSPNDLGYKMPTSCLTSLQKKKHPLLQNAPVNKAEPHLLQKCNPLFLHLSHLIQKNLFEPLSPSPVGVHPRRFWFSSSDTCCEMRQLKHILAVPRGEAKELYKHKFVQKPVCQKTSRPGLAKPFLTE